MNTRILITGSRGQLGSTLREVLAARDDVNTLYTDVAELDITCRDAVMKMAEEFRPDYIVNCAAYTAVDRAETDEPAALRINAHAVENLALAARHTGARMVHVSTDYVFSGENFRPWTETDIPAPRSAYGRTKLAGEQALMNILPHEAVILRTAWLYSPFGSNFVKTMLRLASERPEIAVVADQTGTPTSALTLARAIATVIFAPQWHPGIYHLTDSGTASWYDLAHEAIALAGCHCMVRPITSDEYPSPTPRPFFSLLSKKKFTDTYAVTLPHWREALAECVSRIVAQHS